MATEQTAIRPRMEEDLRRAMKAGDVSTRDALRYALAAIKNAEIDRRGSLTSEDELGILRRLQKQHDDSIEQFRAAGRDDLADREARQRTVIGAYLPTEMSDQDLDAAVVGVIAEVGASGPKDMANVMPVLMKRMAGQVDGRRISQAASRLLAAKG
jgi:uncharacterized protein YqeY